MKPGFFLTLLATAILITISCKENINTITETEIEPKPGRRDYVWTADTIKDRLWVNKFVGESANDVWAVNMDGGGNDCIYRFDGNKWYPFILNLNEPIYTLLSAYIKDGKIWFTSWEGDIWLYYNGKMKKEAKFSYENNSVILFDIDGKSANEIYIAGGRGIGYTGDGSLYSYNGTKWIQKALLKGFGKLIKIRYSKRSNCYFMWGYVDGIIDDKDLIYKYDGSNLTSIFENDDGSLRTMNVVDDYLYLTVREKVYMYHKNGLELVFTDLDKDFGGRIYGRNKNDLLVRMVHGLKHWNGKSLEYIFKTPQNIETKGSMIVFENDVFLDARDLKTNYNIIYHGKLK